MIRLPLSRTELSYGRSIGYAERGVTVHDGDADLDFQCLLVNAEMDLAPDSPLGTAMLARLSGKQFPRVYSDPPHSTRLRPQS